MEKKSGNSRLDQLRIQRERLKEQADKLKSEIQKVEALDKAKERKKEMRRNIIVGAYYREEALKNGTTKLLKETIINTLKRKADQELFVEL